MKKLLALLMAMTMVLLMSVNAFAAGGDGSGGGKGNGSGGGSDEAMSVESASVEDGAVIGAEDSITLVFSKNVCHKSVRDLNMILAVLTDSEGNEIAIEVVLCDDQIEPDKKNDYVIDRDRRKFCVIDKV